MNPKWQPYLANALIGIVLTAISGWSLHFLEDNPYSALCGILGSLFLLILWFIWRQQPWILFQFLPPTRLTEMRMRLLVKHTQRLYFAFAGASPVTDFSEKLLEEMWRWHFRANCYHNLFLARDVRRGASQQMKSINFVCMNRQEFAAFQDEPRNTLQTIASDLHTTEEVKRHARDWLERLTKLGEDVGPKNAPPAPLV
jgi:hypothetical protein